MTKNNTFEHKSVQSLAGIHLNLDDLMSAELENLGAGFYTLLAGETAGLAAPKHEGMVVICNGSITVSSDIGQQVLSRTSVFEEKMSGVFFSSLESLQIKAGEDARFIICCAELDGPLTSPLFDYLDAQQAVERTVGEGSYQRRVDTLLGSDYPAQKLLLGETFNEAGKWSTYPLHKHEQSVPGEESQHEEIFLFTVEPELGFGFQRVFTDDNSLDESSAVFDGTRTLIPRGYHPVSALPHTQLCYFWVLSGNERQLRLKETLIEP